MFIQLSSLDFFWISGRINNQIHPTILGRYAMNTVQDSEKQELSKYNSIDDWIEHGRQLHSAAVFGWVMKAVMVFKRDTTKVAGASQQQNIECLH